MSCLAVLLSLEAVQAQQAPPEATPQRPTFTNDTSTSAPGTLELEFGATGPATTISLPVSMKFTPAVECGLFHRMEFSLGFDTLERIPTGDGSDFRFGDSLDLAVRRPVWSGNGLSFAVAPRIEVFLRDNKGSVIGGSGIAVYGFGLNSLVLNVVGLGATSPSEDNPAWVAKVAGGYGRALGSSRFAVALEVQHEWLKGQESGLSFLQALNFRARPDLVFDVAVEQRGLRSGEFEMVLLGGLTYNLGTVFR